MRTSSLQQEIEGLESRLDPASGSRTVEELAQIRRDLADDGVRKPAIELPNLRLGFACKQRWEEMVGDERVRACAGCDRPVFNLSAMTRAEAERLLATRGLTPCVRFYRRPDGTVMTSDCPTGERRERRRLAVVAGSLAAGAAIASPSVALASPDPAPEPAATPEPADSDATESPTLIHDETESNRVILEDRFLMGIPAGRTFLEPEPRPKLAWGIWGRLGVGFSTRHPQPPGVLARTLTPPDAGSSPVLEAALAADVTIGVARDGNIRLGAFAELRTTSGPVAGGTLVVEGLPPHPMTSRIDGTGTIVLRAGGNAHVITTALGVGYVGSLPRSRPWIPWASHVVGARFVASVNRSLDDPRDWSATFGLEIEPLGLVHAVVDAVTEE